MEVDVANLRLVEMEHRSFELVRAGRQEQAKELLFSSAYEDQKAIYAHGITETKAAVQRRVDERLHRNGRQALAGLGLTLASLLALTFGWARVVGLVRSSLAERLALHEQLEHAVQARDEFLSIASHELKTPLTALSLLVESLTSARLRAETVSDPGKVERKLTMVERQVHRLTRLVDQLLDTSRITSGRMILTLEDDVDLSEIVVETVSRFKEALAHASCEVEVHGVRAPIKGRWDRLRLEQVLSNLLTNAMKYGAGKPIEVDADATESKATLTVRDHGIGIYAGQAKAHLRAVRASRVRSAVWRVRARALDRARNRPRHAGRGVRQ